MGARPRPLPRGGEHRPGHRPGPLARPGGGRRGPGRRRVPRGGGAAARRDRRAGRQLADRRDVARPAPAPALAVRAAHRGRRPAPRRVGRRPPRRLPGGARGAVQEPLPRAERGVARRRPVEHDRRPDLQPPRPARRRLHGGRRLRLVAPGRGQRLLGAGRGRSRRGARRGRRREPRSVRAGGVRPHGRPGSRGDAGLRRALAGLRARRGERLRGPHARGRRGAPRLPHPRGDPRLGDLLGRPWRDQPARGRRAAPGPRPRLPPRRLRPRDRGLFRGARHRHRRGRRRRARGPLDHAGRGPPRTAPGCRRSRWDRSRPTSATPRPPPASPG